MPLVSTFRLGGLRCHALEGGSQRLDGGAMFGVVPRPLWAERAPPDARNRIPLALRCLLVEHPDGLVLVESGLGNKESERFHERYGVENRGRLGPTQLEDALAEAGHAPADIGWVVNTHLHFDHAGGNTVREPDGSLRLAFEQARYLVQRGELDFARQANERTRASYLGPNFEPVAARDRWRLLQDEETVVPGIRVRLTPGHVPWHQSVLLSSEGETAVFLGDLVPTAQHLPLPWIMGYDLEPLRTLESKRALLEQAVAGNWLLLFGHDPRVVGGRVVRTGRDVELVDPIASPRPL